MSPLKEVEFTGVGPFVVPLLAKFVGVQAHPGEKHLVAEFQFEDGPTIHVPIEIQAALGFADVVHTLPAVFASQARNVPKS